MSTDPLIGVKLGDYAIRGLLGRGGMSRVYRGYDENLDRYAAVKVISGDFVTTTEEEYTRRFQIEARSIARLRHPNIVGIYQFGRTEGIYYMAMVFLEGRDLRQLLKEYIDKGQRIPFQEILRIARDVAGALDYAHEQGVIHRDIKPSNIMLEKRTGRAILMDFGLALSVQEGTTGDTFGSAHYIAPEQAISSAKAVSQSDLYSLGIVLYEMLAGKVPFDDPSAMSVALKHLNEVPPPPSLYNPDLPPSVEAVILRVLEKDPEKRYKTGSDLVDALDKAFAGQPVNPRAAQSTSVVDMIESKPAVPASKKRSAPKKASKPRPTPQVAPFQVEEPEKAARGVAGRFARRKAHKEEAAALQTAGEESFQIDDDTLSKILDTYSDPREIGLVGPEAKGITLPEKPATPGGDLRTSAASPPKRRSRTGLLFTLLLAVIVIIGGAYLAWGQGGGGGEGTGTPAAALAGREQTATALRLRVTETAIARGSATAASIVTRTIPASPTEKTVTKPVGAVVEPTNTLVRQPTGTAPLSTAPSLTPRSTTATPPATNTLAPTRTPTASPRPNTPAPTLTPTSPSAAASPANLRMVYNGGQFLLVNISDQTLDVSGLVFEQQTADGKTLAFEGSLWRGAADMEAGGCFQLFTAEATQAGPDKTVCSTLLGWYRAASRRYFWISAQPDATFTLRYAGQTTLVGSCTVAAGDCSLYLSAK